MSTFFIKTKTDKEHYFCLFSLTSIFNRTAVEIAGKRDPASMIVVRVTRADACSQPMAVGPCRGSFIRWYYDTETRRCRMFTYGGCRGNANRFDSAKQCQSTCAPSPTRQPPDVSLTTSTPAIHSLPGESSMH